MKRLFVSITAILIAASLIVSGCGQAAPAPAPTKAPAAPAPTQAPAKPAEPTKAPAAATTAPAAPTKAPEATKPAAAPTAAPAAKVAWPEKGKPITFVVPWAAGSPNDLWARLFASYLERELGTSVQVVDKPGASGQVGMTDFVKAKPDGYTLVTNSLQTTVGTYLDPERQPLFSRKDFQPISIVLMEPFGLVVKGDSRFKTAKDLVDEAKANPEKVKVGDNGNMSPSHLASLLLEMAAGVKFASVHFAGSNEAIASLLGGHIDGSSSIATGFQGQLRANEIRCLGVYDKVESKGFPGAKTLPSQGYNAIMVRTLGFDAPAGTPAPIIEILDAATKKITETNEDYKKKAEEAGMLIRYGNTKEYVAHWDEVDRDIKTVLDAVKKARK